MNVKKKVVTFKRLLMGRTIQRNQHNFFQMFQSIWVSALEFGRKSTAEVILLLCLWKIISRACWGGLHANDWLIDVQIYEHGHGIVGLLWLEMTSKIIESNTKILFGNMTLVLLSSTRWLRWALRSHFIPSLGRVSPAALAQRLDINYWQKT